LLINDDNPVVHKVNDQTFYTDEKEELELLLLSGNLSISKNEKLT